MLTPDIELGLLVDAVYQQYHYDFRQYAWASVRRRVAAAMLQLGCETVSQVQDRVLHDRAAFQVLLNALTVPVSDLFRDPPYFLAVRQHIVPLLRTYPSLKVWVAGCSTGEEVYSLAILLHEEGLLEQTIIYATDINGERLKVAESGVYALDRLTSFTQNHQRAGGRGSLSHYYVAAYGRAVFDKVLRRNVVFSDHSLATDSVFAEVQLVSCRNVLIYFNRDLQQRAVGLFREALCPGGFLGLGARESLRFTCHADAFRQIVPGERLFQKRRST
ncbi:MAG: protein-glutamate O-methyltransferase CheR [Vicinamibacterales bacterium]